MTREKVVAPTPLRFALRFDRRDQAALERLQGRLQSGEGFDGEPNLFRYAADATARGEPLIVDCEDVDEVRQIAAYFVRLGCHEPVLEGPLEYEP